MTTNQHIYCKINTCKHNEASQNCSLTSIEVAPCKMAGNVSSADDSKCASYVCKHC